MYLDLPLVVFLLPIGRLYCRCAVCERAFWASADPLEPHVPSRRSGQASLELRDESPTPKPAGNRMFKQSSDLPQARPD